jgi:hypothetical protein
MLLIYSNPGTWQTLSEEERNGLMGEVDTTARCRLRRLMPHSTAWRLR